MENNHTAANLDGHQKMDMKCVGGIWLPAEEQHLVEWMTKIDMKVGGKLTYQYGKLHLAMKSVPPERRRIAVDVGAHVGLWTMHLCKWFKHVEAFEPNAALMPCFLRNVPMANVSLHGVALGPHTGTCGLRRFDGNTGHTMHSGITDAGSVPMQRLDEFEFENVDFIKIDVEGYEPGVIEGARETIMRCRPVMVVEEKDFGKEHGFKPMAAIEMLEAMGMTVLHNIGGDHIMVWQ